MKASIKILSTIGLTALLLLVLISQVHGFELSDLKPDDFGLYLLSGKETSWSRLASDESNYSERGMGLETGFYIGEKWKLYLRAEFRRYEAERFGIEKHGRSTGLGLSLRREFRAGPLIPYAGLYCGFSHLSPGRDQPELADSGRLANFGGFLGVEIPITESCSLAYEWSFDHISIILNNNDGGRYHQEHRICVHYKYRGLGAWILGLFQ